MEENKNSGVDMSNYMDSKKKVGVVRALPKNNKNGSKNIIYLAIIAVCILIMAMLWTYYNK